MPQHAVILTESEYDSLKVSESIADAVLLHLTSGASLETQRAVAEAFMENFDASRATSAVEWGHVHYCFVDALKKLVRG